MPAGPGPRELQVIPRLWYLTTLVAVVVILLLAIPAVLLIASARSGSGPAKAPSGAVSVSATVTGRVYLSAPPGVVMITAGPPGPAVLTGRIHWPAGTPAAHITVTRSGGGLRLSYRCPAGAGCAANLRLRLPGQTSLVVDQSAGHIVLAGLTGPVSLTGVNVSVLGTGLRSAAFTARITSGQLTAGFSVPPARVQLVLASAQATLRLPARIRYAVATQVSNGSVTTGIPQSAGSAHQIRAQVDSAELLLLPS